MRINNEMRELAKNPERMLQKYQNVTRQIYENAKIIHYLGNTKPWSTIERTEQAV